MKSRGPFKEFFENLYSLINESTYVTDTCLHIGHPQNKSQRYMALKPSYTTQCDCVHCAFEANKSSRLKRFTAKFYWILKKKWTQILLDVFHKWNVREE